MLCSDQHLNQAEAGGLGRDLGHRQCSFEVCRRAGLGQAPGLDTARSWGLCPGYPKSQPPRPHGPSAHPSPMSLVLLSSVEEEGEEEDRAIRAKCPPCATAAGADVSPNHALPPWVWPVAQGLSDLSGTPHPVQCGGGSPLGLHTTSWESSLAQGLHCPQEAMGSGERAAWAGYTWAPPQGLHQH